MLHPGHWLVEACIYNYCSNTVNVCLLAIISSNLVWAAKSWAERLPVTLFWRMKHQNSVGEFSIPCNGLFSQQQPYNGGPLSTMTRVNRCRKNIRSLTPRLCGCYTTSLINFLHFLRYIASFLHSRVVWQSSSIINCIFVLHFVMSHSSLRCSGIACVNEGSHSFTCLRHVYPQVEWTIPSFTLQPHIITTLQLVFITDSHIFCFMGYISALTLLLIYNFCTCLSWCSGGLSCSLMMCKVKVLSTDSYHATEACQCVIFAELT